MHSRLSNKKPSKTRVVNAVLGFWKVTGYNLAFNSWISLGSALGHWHHWTRWLYIPPSSMSTITVSDGCKGSPGCDRESKGLSYDKLRSAGLISSAIED